MAEFEFPSHVKVGHAVYEIATVSDEQYSDGGYHGKCDNNRRRIAISEGLDRSHASHVLLHELFHAGAKIFSLGVGYDEEERIVDVMSNALSAIFADNPELIMALLAGFCGAEVYEAGEDEPGEDDVIH